MSQSNTQAAPPAKPAKPAKPSGRRPPPAVPPEFQADAIMKMGSPELIRILQDPSATRFRKSKACMRLAMVGDGNAVPALAALLSDPQLSHYARYGLVPIPDPSVDDALRAAAGTLQGGLRVSIIDAIGQRRDPKAMEILTGFMYGTDREAALAAIASIGFISGPAAASALQEGLTRTQDPLRRAVAEAALVCAEGQLAKGERQQALSLFQRLTQTDIPKPVRLAAMHSIITAETSPARPK